MSIRNQLLQILDAAISETPTATPPRRDPASEIPIAAPPPQQRHVAALLKFCGLPEKSTRAKLDELARKFREELAVAQRVEHPAIQHENLIAMAVAGKIKASEVPTRSVLRETFEQTHAIADARAAKYSREAALIAADVLEAALEKLPPFIEQLKTHENVLHSAAGSAPDNEVFAKFEKRLEKHVRRMVENLRENTGVCDPAELLK